MSKRIFLVATLLIVSPLLSGADQPDTTTAVQDGATVSPDPMEPSPTVKLPTPVQVVNFPADPGTWTQQGVDVNGDGSLDDTEDTPVVYYETLPSSEPQRVHFTLDTPGDCPVTLRICPVNPGSTCTKTLFEPGGHRRVNMATIWNVRSTISANCEGGSPCSDCRYSITNVAP